MGYEEEQNNVYQGQPQYGTQPQGYPPQPTYGQNPQGYAQGYPPPQPTYGGGVGQPYGNPYQQPAYQSFEASGAPAPLIQPHHGGEGGEVYTPTDDGKFPETSSYRDLMFAVLFGLHLIAVVVILIVGSKDLHYNDSSSSDDTFVPFDQIGRIIGVCFIAAVAAFIFAFSWLAIMKRHARQLIYFTLIASVVAFLVLSIMAFVGGSIIGGVLLLVCAAFNGLIYYLWRPKIPFATAMLQTVAGLLRTYPAPSHYAYGSLVVQIMWVLLWVPTFAIVQQYENDAGKILSVFLILSLYWVSQVIKNVVHVTASGLFATWYFLSGVGMPANPTQKAFKRATTTSFGSICLGSLLVAILKTMRQLLDASRRNGKDNIIKCLLACILSMLDNLISYFNMYAFTQVAIYGKPFCQAAKDTWQLVKSHGVDAIINDNLISGVLLMGSIMGGVVCAIVGGIIAWILLPHYWIALTIVCFMIGLSLVMLTMEVVESGVATIFVCFAMDPQALHRNQPDLYRVFTETYHGLLL